jgi:hypothetical protein
MQSSSQFSLGVRSSAMKNKIAAMALILFLLTFGEWPRVHVGSKRPKQAGSPMHAMLLIGWLVLVQSLWFHWAGAEAKDVRSSCSDVDCAVFCIATGYSGGHCSRLFWRQCKCHKKKDSKVGDGARARSEQGLSIAEVKPHRHKMASGTIRRRRSWQEPWRELQGIFMTQI